MRWLVYIVTPILFSSCFMLGPTAEQTQLEEEKSEYKSLEKKLQDSIKFYISKHIKLGSEIYKSYDFSEVYEHKPKEIQEYEDLVKRRQRLPYLENTYHGSLEQEIEKTDSLILTKKAQIKASKIHSTYEVGHIFNLSKGNTNKISELIFYHYPNGKIKDVTTSYKLELSEKQLVSYNAYYYQQTIHYNNLDADFQFYQNVEYQFKKERDKSAFLFQVILMIENIKENGALVAEKLVPSIIYKKFPNKTVEKITITKAKHEGFASDKTSSATYQIIVQFSDGQTTINLDEWFRITNQE